MMLICLSEKPLNKAKAVQIERLFHLSHFSDYSLYRNSLIGEFLLEFRADVLFIPLAVVKISCNVFKGESGLFEFVQ